MTQKNQNKFVLQQLTILSKSFYSHHWMCAQNWKQETSRIPTATDAKFSLLDKGANKPPSLLLF
jgi:hypothetical protein